jgi:hypothetical protein
MYPIVWTPSPKYNRGHPAPLIALVHHRMVGTLSSTDSAFTSNDGREASTNFGVGIIGGEVEIHQYVRLGDQAWGNGNWDPSGEWNDRYPTSYVNSRTISIEHHDNGGRDRGNGKGVVPERVIEASLWLDAMLLRGDLAEMWAAGIRFRDGEEHGIARELRAIPVDRNHIFDHHYIAGRLKPYCWRPWADDPVGFPRDRYLRTLRSARTGENVKSFAVPEIRTLAKVRDLAWLYDNSAGAASTGNVRVTPARELVLVGTFNATTQIVAYEPLAEDADTTSRAMFVKAADIESVRPDSAVAEATSTLRAALDARTTALRAIASEAAQAAETPPSP